MDSKPDLSGVHLWLVIMKAHQSLARHAETSISETGMCFTDFRILEILLNKGPLPVNTLAARIGLTSGSGTTAIDRLAARGFVQRGLNPEDRRTRIVKLTAEGQEVITKAFTRHADAMEEAASALSHEERKALLAALRKLGKSIETKESKNVSTADRYE